MASSTPTRRPRQKLAMSPVLSQFGKLFRQTWKRSKGDAGRSSRWRKPASTRRWRAGQRQCGLLVHIKARTQEHRGLRQVRFRRVTRLAGRPDGGLRRSPPSSRESTSRRPTTLRGHQGDPVRSLRPSTRSPVTTATCWRRRRSGRRQSAGPHQQVNRSGVERLHD